MVDIAVRYTVRRGDVQDKNILIFITMPDYSKHRLANWEWCNEYRSRMGEEAYDKYVNRVYELLLSMKPGMFFSIEKNVNPENIDLFVKVCCMCIQEQLMSPVPQKIYHIFNADYTEVRCVNFK
jgi:hypothetical protein